MLRIEWVSKDQLLRESFKRLKNDIGAVQERLSSLQEDVVALRAELVDFREKQKELQNNRNNSESQSSLSTENLRLLIKEIISENSGKPLKEQNTKAADSLSTEKNTETTPIIKQQKDTLKEEIIKSYERNKKDIIKQQILGEAAKGNHTKITLRDTVVDQKKYCSKASFYRYVEELELQGLLSYQRKKGKDVIQTIIQQPIAL